MGYHLIVKNKNKKIAKNIERAFYSIYHSKKRERKGRTSGKLHLFG
jgi:hypothetical protein